MGRKLVGGVAKPRGSGESSRIERRFPANASDKGVSPKLALLTLAPLETRSSAIALFPSIAANISSVHEDWLKTRLKGRVSFRHPRRDGAK